MKKLHTLLLNPVFIWSLYSIQKCYCIQFPHRAFPLWIIHYACLCFRLAVAGIKLHKIPCQSLKCHYMTLVCGVLSATMIIWHFLFVKLYIHTHLLYTFWNHFCITCRITSLSSIMKAEQNLPIKFNRIHKKLIITAEFDLLTHWTFLILPSTSHWYWIWNF
jgi:hypothetical protein